MRLWNWQRLNHSNVQLQREKIKVGYGMHEKQNVTSKENWDHQIFHIWRDKMNFREEEKTNKTQWNLVKYINDIVKGFEWWTIQLLAIIKKLFFPYGLNLIRFNYAF